MIFKRKKYIMIVEDDKDLYEIIKTWEANKSNEKITIVVFRMPEEAMEFFKKNKRRIIAVISDYKMPNIDGGQFLTAINSIKKVYSVLMTAYRHEVMENNIFINLQKAGIVQDILWKPFFNEDLTKKLKVLMT